VYLAPGTWHAGPLEDANVRATRQGTVDARGLGPSGRYRLRCVVTSPWQPARVPAHMHDCIDLLGLHQSRAELLDLCVHARGRAAGLEQSSKQLGIVLGVAGHVGACCGDRDCWPRSRRRLPYAPVGKPDPYQAGELVV
jgi:hypothetical protein